MADRSVPYKILNSLFGGFIANADQVELLGTYVGVLNGVNNPEIALQRIDGTGIGAAIFRFTGAYSAQASNINEWFGGKQLVRMRCIDSGTGPAVSGAVPFDLPGATALNTAFDLLVSAGLPEQITFIVEYTGPADDFLSIRARSAPSPQIAGTTTIIVRSGVAATIEITRNSGTISNYVFRAIGGIGGDGSISADSIKLINPTIAVWDASENGPLPSINVAKGNAYKVVNAPADGSGRFGEVMENDDWVVWQGEIFTSWSASPPQWFVLPAHEVRRITALEREFLTDVELSPISERNTVVRGENYADQAGEIRMKIYSTESDYDPADLNTTGDIDEYSNLANISGRLGIRLTGTQSSLTDVLPNLYVYVVDGPSFTPILNLSRDFSFRGNFGQESDYLSDVAINYGTGSFLRIYVGETIDRYSAPNLDIAENNLSDAVQAKLNRADPSGNIDEQRLQTVESKVSALFPLTPDVDSLVDIAEVFIPESPIETVVETPGYSLMADYRGDADRYESTGVTYDNSGVDVVTYSGLSANLHRAFGFKVAAPANQILLWLVDGADRIPFMDITAAGRIRINSYTAATVAGQRVENQLTFLSRTSGDEFVTTAAGSLSTFTINAYPSGATNRSRSLQVAANVAVNGVDTQAETFFDIGLPAENTAQPLQTTDVSINLGPLHGNRNVNITVGYTIRVSGQNLLIDFNLVSAPADVSIKFDQVASSLSYTAPATITRTDNFLEFADGLGPHSFSGAAEIIISFQPRTLDNTLAVVGGILSNGAITLFNDINTPVPANEFDSVEIPDTIEFRTMLPDHFFIHSDYNSILPRAAQKWAYGFARLDEKSELRVNGELDFTSFVMVGSPNGTRVRVTMDDSNPVDIKFKITAVP